MNSLVPPSSDEFKHIADVQAQREAEHKRRSREISRRSLDAARRQSNPAVSEDAASHGISGKLADVVAASAPDDSRRAKAATLIQRTYRGYRTRRHMKGLGIDASTRWVHALREARFRMLTEPRARSELTGDDGGDSQSYVLSDQPDSSEAPSRSSTAARQKWKKVATIARRAGGDAEDPEDSSSSSSSSSSSDSDGPSTAERKKAAREREEAKAKRRKEARMMGLQYFLEMIDTKHRYGSNLRVYHEEWKKADTNENFFYWLDYGEGRFLDIEACPRERLDREQVRYLSREERQYYLVTVDKEGRLCWAKNGARIDTTEKWKDSIHGIVPAEDPTPAFQPVSGNRTRLLGDTETEESSSSDDDEASEAELEAARAAKYATPSFDDAKGVKKISHMSASTILNKLLRKSVRKNTWIFVADTSFRLYVGIKDSGAFQHSSFLQGSRISAAGLVRVHNGRLTSLSPLSGHYRPPASNFRAFVRSLKEAGADMSRVSISKSYAVLVGLEAYVKTRRRGKELLGKMTRRRDKMVAPEEARRREEDEMDKSASAARERAVVEEEERREREENRTGAQLMEKLRIASRGGVDGKDGEDQGREETTTTVESVEVSRGSK